MCRRIGCHCLCHPYLCDRIPTEERLPEADTIRLSHLSVTGHFPVLSKNIIVKLQLLSSPRLMNVPCPRFLIPVKISPWLIQPSDRLQSNSVQLLPGEKRTHLWSSQSISCPPSNAAPPAADKHRINHLPNHPLPLPASLSNCLLTHLSFHWTVSRTHTVWNKITTFHN